MKGESPRVVLQSLREQTVLSAVPALFPLFRRAVAGCDLRGALHLTSTPRLSPAFMLERGRLLREASSPLASALPPSLAQIFSYPPSLLDLFAWPADRNQGRKSAAPAHFQDCHAVCPVCTRSPFDPRGRMSSPRDGFPDRTSCTSKVCSPRRRRAFQRSQSCGANRCLPTWEPKSPRGLGGLK